MLDPLMLLPKAFQISCVSVARVAQRCPPPGAQRAAAKGTHDVAILLVIIQHLQAVFHGIFSETTTTNK